MGYRTRGKGGEYRQYRGRKQRLCNSMGYTPTILRAQERRQYLGTKERLYKSAEAIQAKGLHSGAIQRQSRAVQRRGAVEREKGGKERRGEERRGEERRGERRGDERSAEERRRRISTRKGSRTKKQHNRTFEHHSIC